MCHQIIIRSATPLIFRILVQGKPGPLQYTWKNSRTHGVQSIMSFAPIQGIGVQLLRCQLDICLILNGVLHLLAQHVLAVISSGLDYVIWTH